MYEVLVNRLGGLSLPRKNVVRLTDRPDMTLDVYRGRKTTIQYNTMVSWEKISFVTYVQQISAFLYIYVHVHTQISSALIPSRP